MKKLFQFLPILFISTISCIALPGEAKTAFVIKNTSDYPITATVGVVKCSTAFGCQEYKQPLTINAKDSIIARQTFFKKDSEKPQSWFSTFEIFPVDGVEMNDPNLPENWKKSTKEKYQIYTFKINK